MNSLKLTSQFKKDLKRYKHKPEVTFLYLFFYRIICGCYISFKKVRFIIFLTIAVLSRFTP